jgi:hypothetical protein
VNYKNSTRITHWSEAIQSKWQSEGNIQGNDKEGIGHFRIFENAMHYLVKTVVVHMRNIELGEMEMMALFGMFLWSDCELIKIEGGNGINLALLAEEISPESLQLAMRVRNEIIIDLHLYYRSQGLSEAEITLKTLFKNIQFKLLFF